MWRSPKRDYKNNSFSADKGNNKNIKLTHLGYQCSHHIETSQSICTVNELAGFYMIRAKVLTDLISSIY